MTKILFLTKASTKTGLGHLIRSRSLANQFSKSGNNLQIKFIVIGEDLVSNLLGGVNYKYEILPDDSALKLSDNYDLCFLDMLSISSDLMDQVKEKSKVKICLSPIFNRIKEVDIFFNRTKYHGFKEDELPPHVFASSKYAIIQEDCNKIKTSTYEENLEQSRFPIAISMGGTDAGNKTYNFIKSLKNCTISATFWVMIGEGYKHSYDQLIDEIKTQGKHEIILAKTNKSMWHILKNCSLAILPGGITTYEAAYAGLPTINLLENEKSYFLIKELEEKNICLYNGLINAENIESVNTTIEDLFRNKKQLMMMHLNSKEAIPKGAGSLILKDCLSILAQKVFKV